MSTTLYMATAEAQAIREEFASQWADGTNEQSLEEHVAAIVTLRAQGKHEYSAAEYVAAVEAVRAERS